jgi:hypothetical protein
LKLLLEAVAKVGFASRHVKGEREFPQNSKSKETRDGVATEEKRTRQDK